MAEYIDKQLVVDMLNARADMATGTNANMLWGYAARIVELIPSADVVPVVHGHWIFEEDGGTRCSVCGRKVKYKIEGMRIPIDLSHMPYCAGCGAKMDEEDKI